MPTPPILIKLCFALYDKITMLVSKLIFLTNKSVKHWSRVSNNVFFCQLMERVIRNLLWECRKLPIDKSSKLHPMNFIEKLSFIRPMTKIVK